MDCNNCGAPMTLVNERNYFICEYCGTYGIPNANRDGVHILGETSEISCPVCQNFLVTAVIDGNRVLQCPNCKGVLFDQWVFAFAVSYLRNESTQPEPPPRMLNRQELDRSLSCPKCNQRMDTHLYGGAGNIVIDNCYSCNLVWLDYGELNKIITALGYDRMKEHDGWK